MSIQERKIRHRQQVRNQILDTAIALAQTQGWQLVSIRKIAEEIEYSLPVIYKYFPSKEDILAEVARGGFVKLQQNLNQIRHKDTDIKITAIKLAQNYVAFSVRYPELYQVMFGLEGVIFQNKKILIEAREMFDLLEQFLTDLIKMTGAKIDNVSQTAEIVWSSLHGIAALSMNDRIYGGKGRYPEIVEDLIKTLFKAWKIG